jgi:hypothetical protein
MVQAQRSEEKASDVDGGRSLARPFTALVVCLSSHSLGQACQVG